MFHFVDSTPREFIHALVKKCFYNSFFRIERDTQSRECIIQNKIN